jgi:hypothetical protein
MRLVEAMRRVNQADDPVLHQVPDINGVRHGGRHPASQLFDERKACDDAGILFA